MSKKPIFFTYFSDLEGSLVAQMVTKQVGNGLETYLPTVYKYTLWTSFLSLLDHSGLLFGPPFWAIFGPKWTKNWGSGAQKGVAESPKRHQKWPKNEQELCRNTLNHFYSWPTWTPRWAIFGHLWTPTHPRAGWDPWPTALTGGVAKL